MTIAEKLQSLIRYGNAALKSSHDNITDVVKELVHKIEPAGLYDDAGNLVCTYEELVSVYGLDAEKDYTKETYLTDPQSGYNVLKQTDLSEGTKLILDDTHIGHYSFSRCENLTHVEVRCAKTMGDAVFMRCEKLISAEICCETIGNATFQYCVELESCIIRGHAVKMEGYTFNGCEKLKDVQLPDGLSLSGRATFQHCSQLDNIVIKGKIHTDAAYMFNNCAALRNLDLSEADFSEIESARTMFQHCTNLQSFTAPYNMKISLSSYMFWYCSALESVDLSASDFSANEDIYGMFNHCTNLQSFTAPYNTRLTSAYAAFNNCASLLSLDLSAWDFANITTAGTMLQGCTNVSEIKFPQNFAVSDYTMNHLCSYPPDENGDFYIPADWRLLNYHPQEGHIFYDFCSLELYPHKRFIVDENNQYFKNDEHGALYTKDGTILLSLPNFMQVENGRYEMAEGVTTLGLMSFNRNKTVETLVIPNSLELHEEASQSVQGKPETYDLDKNNLTRAIYVFTNIRKFEAKPDNPRYMSEGGGIYTKDGKRLISTPLNYIGEFTVKDGCSAICGDAFQYSDTISGDNTTLTQVNIPASVTDIKDYNLRTLNKLTQTVKVIAPDNPVYEVVDNIICLKQKESQVYTDEHRIANDGSPQAEPMLFLLADEQREEIPDTAVEYSECEEWGENMGKEEG